MNSKTSYIFAKLAYIANFRLVRNTENNSTQCRKDSKWLTLGDDWPTADEQLSMTKRCKDEL